MVAEVLFASISIPKRLISQVSGSCSAMSNPQKYTSSLKLYGIINTDGFLYFDKNNPQNYSFDDNIKNVMSKYKCKINEAYYNNVSDKIFLKLKIKLLNIQKTIILKNQNSKNSKNIYQKNDL